MIEQDLRRSKIITRACAGERHCRGIAASGGSTNGVLHTLAFAREAGIPFTIDDIEAISKRTPLICDLTPTGRYDATDMYKAGGVRLLAQRLIEGGYVDGSRADGHGQDAGGRSRERPRNARSGSDPPLEQRDQPRTAACTSSRATSRRTAASSSSRAPSRAVSRPGAHLQPRRRRLSRPSEQQDQGGRRGGDPLRRAGWRARDARDASGDGGAWSGRDSAAR